MKFFAVLQMRSITEEAFSLNITPQKIAGALEKQLSTAFPGETVYIDLTPRDFDRPSNLVELTKIELDALSMGMAAVAIRYQYKITTFCEVDQVHDSHLPALDLRAVLVMSMFGSGYLKVDDRALKVVSCVANTESYDAAEVTITLSLTVDRSEFSLAEIYETMRELTARYDLKEEK